MTRTNLMFTVLAALALLVTVVLLLLGLDPGGVELAPRARARSFFG